MGQGGPSGNEPLGHGIAGDLARVMEALLHMKKFDIEELKRAGGPRATAGLQSAEAREG